MLRIITQQDVRDHVEIEVAGSETKEPVARPVLFDLGIPKDATVNVYTCPGMRVHEASVKAP